MANCRPAFARKKRARRDGSWNCKRPTRWLPAQASRTSRAHCSDGRSLQIAGASRAHPIAFASSALFARPAANSARHWPGHGSHEISLSSHGYRDAAQDTDGLCPSAALPEAQVCVAAPRQTIPGLQAAPAEYFPRSSGSREGRTPSGPAVCRSLRDMFETCADAFSRKSGLDIRAGQPASASQSVLSDVPAQPETERSPPSSLPSHDALPRPSAAPAAASISPSSIP